MNQIITTINLYLMMVTVILLSVLVLVVCVKRRSKHISSILKKSDIRYIQYTLFAIVGSSALLKIRLNDTLALE